MVQALAAILNKDGIPGPNGTAWGASTTYGNWRRGTGVLNNELYLGRLVWNRHRFVKDPETGKRVSRANPEHEWITTEVPALRSVDEETWAKVEALMSATPAGPATPGRPRSACSPASSCAPAAAAP